MTFKNSEIKYPEITAKIIGEDGNVFAVLGAVRQVLRRANVPKEQIDAFTKEATDGDYNHALQTCMRWVNVE